MMTILIVSLILAGALFSCYRLKKESKINIAELKKKTDDLSLIQHLSTEMSSELNMKKLLPKIMEAFARAGEVNKGSIMLLDEDTGELVIKENIGLSERAIKFVRPKIGEGIAGKVAKTGKPILIEDSTKSDLYTDFVYDPAKSRPRETLLCLPLIFGGKVMGIVNLNSKISGKPFIRNDEILLSTLANQASVAIENALTYELAITDSLTKLYIYRYFELRLKGEMDRTKRYGPVLSLAMIDIDHFKNVNDTYGHQAGDRVLIQLAKLMNQFTRATDIVCRYGGEEFAIIMTETDSESAIIACERMREATSKMIITLKDLTLRITISMGIAKFLPSDNISFEEFVKRADLSLYYSKQHGRNITSLYESVKDKIEKK